MDESSVASVERLGQSDFLNMIWIPGGTFRMGSDQHYPEEAPAHRVSLNGFWIRAFGAHGQFRTSWVLNVQVLF
jgi:formylglycine-generating enzyme